MSYAMSSGAKSMAASASDSTLRYADVAHFVGLSLMRGPKPLKAKPVSSPNLHKQVAIHRSRGSEGARPQFYSRQDEPSRQISFQSESSTQPMQKVRSLPSLSAGDQLASPEHEKLKLLDHTLSEFMKTERKAHAQVDKLRERCKYHKRRFDSVSETINRLEEELAAGEEAALQKEQFERQREQRLKWQDQQVRSVSQAPVAVAVHVPSVPRRQSLGDLPLPSVVSGDLNSVPKSDMVDSSLAASTVSVGIEHAIEPEMTEDDQAESDSGEFDDTIKLPDAAEDQAVVSAGAPPEACLEVGSFPITRKISKGGHSSSASTSGADQTALISNLMKQDKIAPEDIVPPNPEDFKSEKELTHYRQERIRKELESKGGSAMRAFKAINLNGSGNICSQEFADGVKRLGIPWQRLTGLRKPRQLFKLFDLEKTGVITFFELFPTERNKVRENEQMSTPRFWKAWVDKNDGMEKGCGGAKWQPGSPEAELQLLYKIRDQNEEATSQHKWISKTFRRMKYKGKSDARAREMVALHLPRGTGPEDLHGVSTLSHLDVQKCKRAYTDAVNEPQRTITKAIDDLKAQRRDIHTCRQHLSTVAVDPSANKHKAEFKQAPGCAISLGIAKHHEEDDHDNVPAEPPVKEQASFGQLARMTSMKVSQIEDVFRVWMRHSDKTETIPKKQFQRLVEDLCPTRTIVDNDLDAWWDQIHHKAFAECLKVDWTAADDKYKEWRKASLGTDAEKSVAAARKSPATFDQFICWWAMCEVRCP